jgi:hypothetical protein
MRPTFRATVVALISCAAAIFTGIQPAQAEVSPSAPVAAAFAAGTGVGRPGAASMGSVKLSVSFSRAAGSGVGIQDVIICEITVDNPHNSGHVPGTVNVVSHVNCTAPVAAIVEVVGLYFNQADNRVGSGGDYRVWMPSLDVNAAANCVPGIYVAAGLAGIYAPPNYLPKYGEISAVSSAALLNC